MSFSCSCRNKISLTLYNSRVLCTIRGCLEGLALMIRRSGPSRSLYAQPSPSLSYPQSRTRHAIGSLNPEPETRRTTRSCRSLHPKPEIGRVVQRRLEERLMLGSLGSGLRGRVCNTSSSTSSCSDDDNGCTHRSKVPHLGFRAVVKCRVYGLLGIRVESFCPVETCLV